MYLFCLEGFSLHLQYCQHPQNSSSSDLTIFLVSMLHCPLTCLLLSGISCFPQRSFLKQEFIFLVEHSAALCFSSSFPFCDTQFCFGQLCSVLMADLFRYGSPIFDGVNSLYHSVFALKYTQIRRSLAWGFTMSGPEFSFPDFSSEQQLLPPSPYELFSYVSKVTCKDWCEVFSSMISQITVENIAHCILKISKRFKEFLFCDFRWAVWWELQ